MEGYTPRLARREKRDEMGERKIRDLLNTKDENKDMGTLKIPLGLCESESAITRMNYF